MIITDTHKLCFYAHRDYGELYDVVNDPDHIRNLWDDPACSGIKLELITRILAHETNKSGPALGPTAAAAEAVESM